MTTVVENAAVVTVDADGREFAAATVVVEGDRITGVDVPADSVPPDAEEFGHPAVPFTRRRPRPGPW